MPALLVQDHVGLDDRRLIAPVDAGRVAIVRDAGVGVGRPVDGREPIQDEVARIAVFRERRLVGAYRMGFHGRPLDRRSLFRQLKGVKTADVRRLAVWAGLHRLDEVLREIPARIVLRDDVATQDQMAGQTAVEILHLTRFDHCLRAGLISSSSLIFSSVHRDFSVNHFQRPRSLKAGRVLFRFSSSFQAMSSGGCGGRCPPTPGMKNG